MRLLGDGALSCQEIVAAVRWKVGPTLVSLERRGLISYEPGRYCEAGAYSVTERGERASLVGGFGVRP